MGEIVSVTHPTLRKEVILMLEKLMQPKGFLTGNECQDITDDRYTPLLQFLFESRYYYDFRLYAMFPMDDSVYVCVSDVSPNGKVDEPHLLYFKENSIYSDGGTLLATYENGILNAEIEE